ncbi:hypothetical protein [Spirosoma gilvum]
MKAFLVFVIAPLFVAQEISYNFGGHFRKGDESTLLIDVRDGDYWVTLLEKPINGKSACELSGRASVRNGNLHVRVQQGEQAITLIVRATDHTRTMVVRGLRKADQVNLTHVCYSKSLAGKYSRME